jgi:hypothetical protein
MAKSVGKQFEEDFSSSFPSYCYVHRLKDSAQSYSSNKNTKFSWDNECDFFVWDSSKHIFYAIECKSTKYKSMSIQSGEEDKSNKMIKYHQIKSLTEISQFDGVKAGFFLNFRDEKIETERTYFINIIDFNKMMKMINKASFNEMDIILNHGVKISGEKKRVHFKWDLDSFLQSQSKMV